MNINSQKPPEHQVPSRTTPQAQNTQKPSGAEHKEQVAQAKKTAPADRVQISDQSKQIADIMSAVNQLPDVRENKVQEIKKSVDAGTYTVDPRKIAESILKSI